VSAANEVPGGGLLQQKDFLRTAVRYPHPTGLRPATLPTRGRDKNRILFHTKGITTLDIKVRDSNGALLAEGDSVTLIKDLKLKGSSTVLKRGTVIKGIHLTDNADEIEGRTDKVKGLVLRTEFLKKA
jgi:protein PhnA